MRGHGAPLRGAHGSRLRLVALLAAVVPLLSGCVAPVNLGRPALSGPAEVGATLVASPGTWFMGPASFEYLWRRCSSGGSCVDLGSTGGTASRVLVSADVGHSIRVVVVARNVFGAASAESSGTALVTSPTTPRVDAVTPARAPVSGGTGVTISGARLTGATSVTFGALAASSFTVVSDARIDAVVPAAPGPGPVNLVVATPAGTSPPVTFTYEPLPPPPGSPALVGAGDVAYCANLTGAHRTAALLDAIAGTVFVAGDGAYNDGTLEEFQTCYGPTWGRHLSRTRPAVGNHEYQTAGAAGYFGYFGAAAAPPDGWYSYDVGSWHVVVLNSNCSFVGGCGPGSRQMQWLQADLAAHPAQCTLAYWHHPMFSSALERQYVTNVSRPFWDALYAAGADVVVNGHLHNYERFAPQTPAGQADPASGIRQFVAGTGGAGTSAFGGTVPNSEIRNSTTFGVLRLELGPDRYAWQFVPEAGKTFTDSGVSMCH